METPTTTDPHADLRTAVAARSATRDLPDAIDDATASRFLALTVECTREVMEQIRNAIQRVKPAVADAVHSARIDAQAERFSKLGVKQDEKSIARLHPLYHLWQLQMKIGKLMRDLLAVSNPELFARRKVVLDRTMREAKLQAIQEELADAEEAARRSAEEG
jgi:hypothetical protein